jgi:hypothetical protein
MEEKKGGAWFANLLTDINRTNAAIVAAIYADHAAYDDDGNLAKGVDLEIMTAAMRSTAKRMTKPGAGTEDIESALASSAILLGHLSATWITSASGQHSVNGVGLFSHLALRALEQQRKTLATLANIRNPKRVAFVKQLNQAVNQQVNNGAANSLIDPISEKIQESRAPELLEVIPSERLDTRTQSQAISGDPQMEALDAQHRPENRGRKGQE